MATFLDLCQRVVLMSGTIPGQGSLASVAAATGRLAQIVAWVDEAWSDIQTERDDWRFMQRESSLTLLADTREHTSVALPAADAARFGSWLLRHADGAGDWSAYPVASGVALERPLRFLAWETFYETFTRGTQTKGGPVWFTITPREAIQVHPIPDADWTVRLRFSASPQALTADGDVPDMPARFHDAIHWGALCKLALYDEAWDALAGYERGYNRYKAMMVREQTPPVRLGGALA